jgi:hypothetical protein
MGRAQCRSSQSAEGAGRGCGAGIAGRHAIAIPPNIAVTIAIPTLKLPMAKTPYWSFPEQGLAAAEPTLAFAEQGFSFAEPILAFAEQGFSLAEQGFNLAEQGFSFAEQGLA